MAGKCALDISPRYRAKNTHHAQASRAFDRLIALRTAHSFSKTTWPFICSFGIRFRKQKGQSYERSSAIQPVDGHAVCCAPEEKNDSDSARSQRSGQRNLLWTTHTKSRLSRVPSHRALHIRRGGCGGSSRGCRREDGLSRSVLFHGDHFANGVQRVRGIEMDDRLLGGTFGAGGRGDFVGRCARPLSL